MTGVALTGTTVLLRWCARKVPRAVTMIGINDHHYKEK